MRIVNIHEAKIIDAVLHVNKRPQRRLGVLKGNIKIAKDFDAPLSDELLGEFEE